MNTDSLDHDNQIDNKVQIILRQTDYTEQKAREKLQQFNNNEIAVIKDYFGITEKKAPQVISVNQEIYKQLRSHLDSSMKDYRERVEKGEVKKIV
jgi:fatty acid/phospholipid biosynthesis enzyme